MSRRVRVLVALVLAACSTSGPTDPPAGGKPSFTRVVPDTAEPNVTVGQSLTFEVEARSESGAALSYEYRLDKRLVATAARYVFEPADTGRFRIEALVSDGVETLTRAWSVRVAPPPNTPPAAGLDLDPASGTAPLAVRVRLEGSDPDGVVTRHRVELSGAASLIIERAVPIDTLLVLGAGDYIVTGTVEDDRGATRVVTGAVHILPPPPPPPNRPPTLTLDVKPASGEAPLVVSAQVVASDEDGHVVSVSIDFDGDGVADAASPGATLTALRTYASPGAFAIRAVVLDDGGAEASATATIEVRAPNIPPAGSLTASAARGDAPLALTLSAAGSDPDGRIVRWELDADDGGGFADLAGAGQRPVSYPFRSAAYRPRLRLTDDRGAVTVIDGPAILVHRPISATRSSGAATGNPRFASLTIAPAIWADGDDRLRFAIEVRDHEGGPLADTAVRVTPVRPAYTMPDGAPLQGPVTVALEGAVTDADGRLRGELTTRTSSRAYGVPQTGSFRPFLLRVEADAGHGEWRRLPDIGGLNAETVVDGSTGTGSFHVIPGGLTCVGAPLQIRVRAMRRADAPGGGGPAAGMVAEVRYASGGGTITGLAPAPGYESWRTDADGWIVFRVTPAQEDFRALYAWVDGQPLGLNAAFAVATC